jgi:hypothetical protein
VRSSIQIRAEISDLEKEVLRAVVVFEADPTPESLCEYNATLPAAAMLFAELHQELAGDHFSCAVATLAAAPLPV